VTVPTDQGIRRDAPSDLRAGCISSACAAPLGTACRPTRAPTHPGWPCWRSGRNGKAEVDVGHGAGGQQVDRPDQRLGDAEHAREVVGGAHWKIAQRSSGAREVIDRCGDGPIAAADDEQGRLLGEPRSSNTSP
jgi:hypothetical protein